MTAPEKSTWVALEKETTEHDMAVGPCKCGVWHDDPSPECPPGETPVVCKEPGKVEGHVHDWVKRGIDEREYIICGDCGVSRTGDSECPKCNGTGWFSYDMNHSTICDLCCKHDKGYWLLTEHYAGYEAGHDNWCCAAGCGQVLRYPIGSKPVVIDRNMRKYTEQEHD